MLAFSSSRDIFLFKHTSFERSFYFNELWSEALQCLKRFWEKYLNLPDEPIQNGGHKTTCFEHFLVILWKIAHMTCYQLELYLQRW